ncbi:MAG: transposase, partial [Gemmatimonadales bacterium]
DAFVVMPNHFHAIVFLPKAPLSSLPSFAREPGSLGSLIAGYKAVCTSRINTLLGVVTYKIWQRNYYESLIRNAGALAAMRRYIAANPARWSEPRLMTAHDASLGRPTSDGLKGARCAPPRPPNVGWVEGRTLCAPTAARCPMIRLR